MTSRYDDLSRPPLNAAELARALTQSGSRWREVTVVDASPSTNADLANRARTDFRDGLVLVAEHQTAGRGRLDRTWVAAPRAGITMSALVRPLDVPVSRWSWIPLLSGLAVAAAVRQVAEVEAELKWPNDVIVGDRKLAGLLVERVDAGATAADAAAVIGIGLNVSTTRAELPTPYATSLALESATTTDRTTLVKAILRRLDGLLGEWEVGAGVASGGLQDAYLAACTTIGQRVRVELAGQPDAEGEAVGLDQTGRLLVETATGRQAFGAGDVMHVRRPA
jgi:BirA family biotin operon repressor/biotin-[acetyl-CoA-carboxylase] ligase